MKKPSKQILALLQAFKVPDVKKGIKLYQDTIVNGPTVVEKRLNDGGWIAQQAKPTGAEFYFLNEKYWVQTEEGKRNDHEVIKASMARRITENKEAENRKTGKGVNRANMDLAYIDALSCSQCGGGLYKQKICPGCKEGKRGFQLRLICEENSEHEFLI